MNFHSPIASIFTPAALQAATVLVTMADRKNFGD